MRSSLKFLIKNKSLYYPNFRKYLTYRVSMVMALNMQMTIISYFVYKLTNDVFPLGMLGLAEVIPAIGFSFISGHFVDINEKKGVLIKCTIGYLMLSLFFMMLSWPQFYHQAGLRWTVWLLYFGVFVGGALRAFFSPASFSLLGLIIPRKEYPNAGTWSSSAWHIGAILGPIVAGSLIALTRNEVSLLVVFCIQLFSMGAILLIPKQPIMKKGKEPILKSLQEGLRFVFRTKIILTALSLDMFAVLFGGATALLPVYAKDILRVNEVGFGWMRAAPGIGAIIMSAFLVFIPLKTKPGIKLLVCIAGFGVSTIVFGISRNFALSISMLMLGGMFDQISVIIRGTLLQLQTPDEMRGRVSAVSTMFISSSNELGAAESGLTAKWMGTVPAVVFGGIMTLVVVGITHFSVPGLRKYKYDITSKENKT